MNLNIDPGGVFRIPDEPVGGFQLIVPAGPGIQAGRDMLKRFTESPGSPEEPDHGGDAPNHKENCDCRETKAHEKVDDLEEDRKKQRDCQARSDLMEDTVTPHSLFRRFQ